MRLGPMFLVGVFPLQILVNRSRWMNTVGRLWFGCAAFSAVATTAQAQTYYYYPTSVPAAPSVVNGATFALPTYVSKGPWVIR